MDEYLYGTGSMAQLLLDLTQISSFPQKMDRDGVPSRMD